MPRSSLLFAALVLTASAFAQEVNLQRLVRARYVIVAVPAALGQVDFRDSVAADPRDRAARARLEKSLREWKRYAVTLHPGQADLLFLVRTARIGSIRMRLGSSKADRERAEPGRIPAATPNPAPPEPDSNLALGGEVQSLQHDMLEVYAMEDGKPGMLLWRGVRKDGLTGRAPALLAEYRKNVEQTAKKLGLP